MIDSLQILLPELIPMVIEYVGSWYVGTCVNEDTSFQKTGFQTIHWFFRDSYMYCACEEPPTSEDVDSVMHVWKRPVNKNECKLHFQPWLTHTDEIRIHYAGDVKSFAMSLDEKQLIIQSGGNCRHLANLPSFPTLSLSPPHKKQRIQIEPTLQMGCPSRSVVWIGKDTFIQEQSSCGSFSNEFNISKWSKVLNDFDERYLHTKHTILGFFPLSIPSSEYVWVITQDYDDRNLQVLDTKNYYQLGAHSQYADRVYVHPISTFQCRSSISSYSLPILIPNRYIHHAHEFVFSHDSYVYWIQWMPKPEPEPEPETKQLVELGYWKEPIDHQIHERLTNTITCICMLQDGCSCAVIAQQRLLIGRNPPKSICYILFMDKHKKQLICQKSWEILDSRITSIEEFNGQLVMWDEKLRRHLFYV